MTNTEALANLLTDLGFFSDPGFNDEMTLVRGRGALVVADAPEGGVELQLFRLSGLVEDDDGPELVRREVCATDARAENRIRDLEWCVDRIHLV